MGDQERSASQALTEIVRRIHTMRNDPVNCLALVKAEVEDALKRDRQICEHKLSME